MLQWVSEIPRFNGISRSTKILKINREPITVEKRTGKICRKRSFKRATKASGRLQRGRYFPRSLVNPIFRIWIRGFCYTPRLARSARSKWIKSRRARYMRVSSLLSLSLSVSSSLTLWSTSQKYSSGRKLALVTTNWSYRDPRRTEKWRMVEEIGFAVRIPRFRMGAIKLMILFYRTR